MRPMTEADKLLTLSVMCDEKNHDVLRVYLRMAESAILNRLYPFDEHGEHVMPSKYDDRQIEIACYLIDKRGAEGQLAHSENGISRTYESASVPPSMLEGIIPYAEVIF